MTLRQTHTYAVLEVSVPAYDEIKEKLLAADYKHAFIDDKIDMHGIGLARGPVKTTVLAVNTDEDTAQGDLRNVLQILLGLKDPAYGGDATSNNLVVKRSTVDALEKRILHALAEIER